MTLLAADSPWQSAAMLHGFLMALVDVALAFAAWWAPIVYVVGAGVITHRVAGDNARARAWLGWSFAAVGILLVLLVFGWPGALDGP
ncbi:MAG: hypothetical protein EOS03_12415 [Mesorhizobium sp.]|uniref:hypothetical protein n=1 Tax=Mesorhizobium sp. TaxID=1871066 RepID=UPI000FEA6341|nr:hypothetical protein [Mesorhizobium sp.]RWN47155.1 MAG: hypothetical protein EOS03_12415 [Mesorhizobium sp.]